MAGIGWPGFGGASVGRGGTPSTPEASSGETLTEPNVALSVRSLNHSAASALGITGPPSAMFFPLTLPPRHIASMRFRWAGDTEEWWTQNSLLEPARMNLGFSNLTTRKGIVHVPLGRRGIGRRSTRDREGIDPPGTATVRESSLSANPAIRVGVARVQSHAANAGTIDARRVRRAQMRYAPSTRERTSVVQRCRCDFALGRCAGGAHHFAPWLR